MLVASKDEKKSNKLFNLTPEERRYFEMKAKEIEAQKSLYDNIMKEFSEKQSNEKMQNDAFSKHK